MKNLFKPLKKHEIYDVKRIVDERKREYLIYDLMNRGKNFNVK